MQDCAIGLLKSMNLRKRANDLIMLVGLCKSSNLIFLSLCAMERFSNVAKKAFSHSTSSQTSDLAGLSASPRLAPMWAV